MENFRGLIVENRKATASSHSKVVILTFCTICLLPGQLFAQESETKDILERDVETTVTIRGESVGGYGVFEASTATKIPTPIMEVPMAVQVVPRQVILDQQSLTLGEVLENVSGVQLTGSRFGLLDRFSARGFALDARSNFYKNGRPFSFITPPPIETLESVEFLKGPASVLYGQAEPGGIVNMVLKRPTFRSLHNINIQGGSYGHRKFHLDSGGPITATTGYRLNLATESNKGARDFAYSDQNLINLAASWNPTHWLAINVNSLYQQREQNADSGLIFAPGLPGQLPDQNFGRYNRVADIPVTQSLNEDWTKITVDAREASYDLSATINEHWQFNHAFSWQYQNNDELRIDPVNLLSRDVPENNELRGDLKRISRDRSREQRVLFADIGLLGEYDFGIFNSKLLIGAEKMELELGFQEFRLTGFPRKFNIYDPAYNTFVPTDFRAPPFLFGRESLSQSGIYFQEQLSVAGRLHIMFGARKDNYDNALDTTTFLAGAPATNDVFDDENGDTTYRAGLLFEATSWASIYGSYSQGFVPSISVYSDQILPPQESEQTEFGLKLSLLDGFVLATASVFELTKTNGVITNPVSGTLQITGARESKGFEFDLIGEVYPGWNLVANYSFLKAEVTKGDPRSSDTIGVSSTISSVGNIPPGAPRHKLNLWSTYRFQSGLLNGLRVGLGVNGRTIVQGDLHNSIQHEAYTTWQAMLGYKFDSAFGGWDAQLKFNNINDAVYFNSFNSNFIQPSKPFSVLGQINFNF